MKKSVSQDSANIHLFKVTNRSTRRKCEICSKLTVKAPVRRHWLCPSFFIVNFDVEQVNASWG